VTSTALVITSISPPNNVLKDYAREVGRRDIPFLLIGDRSSPADFTLAGCDFWSIERQKTLPFRLAGIIPEKHYARKNLGYLQAIQMGVETIIETDDDNFARSGFWEPREFLKSACKVEGTGWINVYKYFTDAHIWPRGYPLEHLHNPLPFLETHQQKLTCPIQQGLADENPDLDAVYRMTYPLPFSFRKGVDVAIGDRQWCPFNSQNTTWFKEAFPLLYLPSFCSFRMTDIWRSFVAQRIGWANGWHILFHSATVWQERNEHNLLKDFSDEIPGYLNNASICKTLENLTLLPGSGNILTNIVTCYVCLIDMQLIGKDELPLLRAWIEDIKMIWA
jgi:hypothetical protein